MGKKRRNYPNLDDLLGRAWCYYCERDFEDLKLLISHQKAKHFKCERCGRRLNTAGGLSVHMNQVHKETLTQVENTLEGREGLDVEIFGMEGIPEEIVMAHNRKIIEDFHKNRAERQAVTGNPPPGQRGGGSGNQLPPHKKIKYETPEELKARLAAFRASGGAKAAAAAAAAAASAAAAGAPPPNAPAGPAGASSSLGLPTRPPAAAHFPPGQFPGGPLFPGQFGAVPPPFLGGVPGGDLPARPGVFGGGGATTLDDLVSGASSGAAAAADDIDRMIRQAEAGSRPGGGGGGDKAEKTEKSEKKKEKAAMRMVYSDGDFSLEERMAQMARYAVAV